MPKKIKSTDEESVLQNEENSDDEAIEDKKSEAQSNSSKLSQIKEKKLSQAEYEKQVIELAKQGLTSEKIGEALKRKGIHSKDYSIKISQILKEKGLYVIPDIKNISEKLEKIKEHSAKYKQDKKAMREKDRLFSSLKKLREYHKTK